MATIQLKGLDEIEIKNVSGNVVYFKEIKIPNEDCSNFFVRYIIKNPIALTELRSISVCMVSPYSRDSSHAPLNKSILISKDSMLYVRLESSKKDTFNGMATLNYEIINSNEDNFDNISRTVFISERDRQNAFRVALKNLGRFFNIENWKKDDNKTLFVKIINTGHPIVDLLKNYFTAYNKWFEFYSKIKEIESNSGQKYYLTIEDQEELASLISSRVKALTVLQEAFDELQFKKFQKTNGLENIDGILHD